MGSIYGFKYEGEWDKILIYLLEKFGCEYILILVGIKLEIRNYNKYLNKLEKGYSLPETDKYFIFNECVFMVEHIMSVYKKYLRKEKLDKIKCRINSLNIEKI